MRSFIVSVASCFLAIVSAFATDVRSAYPVTFIYDGQAFSPQAWKSSEKKVDEFNSETVFISPDGKLTLTICYKTYPDFPVTEVKSFLECATTEETGIIEDFKSLDFSRSYSSRGIKIRRITGSMSAYTDFCHQDVLLQRRHGCDVLSITSQEGRSSAWLPYLGIDFEPMKGMEIAIGWTGTWRADMVMGDEFRFSTGIDGETHFKMLPGERFQMPYVVIYEREGKTVEEGLVEFHRFVIAHKAPRDSKGDLFKPILPLTASGGNKTDKNMLMIIDKATSVFDVPFDTFWVDAGWYGDYHEVTQDSNCGPFWYENAGNWHPNKYSHPEGNMKKVARAANKKGMRFLLWFEPERATAKAPIVKEHPEYFIQSKSAPNDNVFLVNFANPDAASWVLEEVSRNIRESGVQIYRQDFNCDPLPIWRENDPDDRKGVAEIKHINGLWSFWENLHQRFPDMLMESCAGGGRRLDIHIMSYAHSYCRDDAHMFANPEELTQNITLNSTPYVPFTGGETFMIKPFDTYGFLSCLGASTVFTPTDFQGMFLHREPSSEEISWFEKMLKTTDRIRKYYFGDFYALTGGVLDGSDIYAGYQLNDLGKGEGFFIVFRRQECPEDSFQLKLRGIDPDAAYTVEEFEGGTAVVKGSDLARQTLIFPEPRSYKLVFYKKR